MCLEQENVALMFLFLGGFLFFENHGLATVEFHIFSPLFS